VGHMRIKPGMFISSDQAHSMPTPFGLRNSTSHDFFQQRKSRVEAGGRIRAGWRCSLRSYGTAGHRRHHPQPFEAIGPPEKSGQGPTDPPAMLKVVDAVLVAPNWSVTVAVAL
jgi:hypothetical protein